MKQQKELLLFLKRSKSMSETFRIVFEILFNIFYLVFIWFIVFLMIKNFSRVSNSLKKISSLIRLAFIFLAVGDTGHVGFRVIAYLTGGLEKSSDLVGIGMLATAVTVTFFYMLMVYIWSEQFGKKIGWVGLTMLAAGFIRLIIMFLPGNEWGSIVPPQPMGIIRNLPLIYQGLGIMILLFRDSAKTKNKPFLKISWMIFLSYLFYIPVILFADKVPLLGLLMIPKTCAYLAVAVIAYNYFWKNGLQK